MDGSDLSDFEVLRLQQIARNQALLESLGLGAGLGIRIEVEQRRKAAAENIKAARAPAHDAVVDSIAPRRSSRLQGQSAPRYLEPSTDTFSMPGAENEDQEDEECDHSRPLKDVYTVAQLNALGSCATSYDVHPDRLGRKTTGFGVEYIERRPGVIPCHWHRHNTRDPHVKCANGERCTAASKKWKGSFWCGPCLQNRYGENIFEIGVATQRDFVYPSQVPYSEPPPEDWDCMANAQRPSWVCPACRGICNCSTKGCLRDRWEWGDTGALVGRASRNGYDSSAHYLIMGHFDALLTSLELGLVQHHRSAIRRHLRIAEYSLSVGGEGDPKVVQRHKTLPKEQGPAAEVLFCCGANAKEVVDQLRALVERAKLSLANASGLLPSVQPLPTPPSDTTQVRGDRSGAPAHASDSDNNVFGALPSSAITVMVDVFMDSEEEQFHELPVPTTLRLTRSRPVQPLAHLKNKKLKSNPLKKLADVVSSNVMRIPH